MKNIEPAEIQALKKELADEQYKITERKRQNDEVCLAIKKHGEEIEKIREELLADPEARRELARIRTEIAGLQLQQSMAAVVQFKEEPQEEMSERHDMVSRSPEPEPSFYVSIL